MATWKDAAACRDEDTDLFFPAGHGAEFAPQIEEAKAFCKACPVRHECLRDAIHGPERYGVWGGLEEHERGVLRRRDRRRVHPRFSEKECPACGEFKAAAEFYDGDARCRGCKNAQRSEQRRAAREKAIA